MLQRTEIVHTADAAATRLLGAALGPLLHPGMLVLLSGPLGAGKTTLVQGIAAGLGIAARIQSPTFTLVHEYPLGRPPDTPGNSNAASPIPRVRLVHMDCYRLSSPAEVQSLGLEDYLAGDDIVVIEWPEHAGGALPDEALHILMAFAPAVEPGSGSSGESGDEGRRVTLTAQGTAAVAVLSALRTRLPPGAFATAEPAHG